MCLTPAFRARRGSLTAGTNASGLTGALAVQHDVCRSRPGSSFRASRKRRRAALGKAPNELDIFPNPRIRDSSKLLPTDGTVRRVRLSERSSFARELRCAVLSRLQARGGGKLQCTARHRAHACVGIERRGL